MNIETITEYFYKKTSERIRKAYNKVKGNGKLSYEKIYPSDPKLISRIINNKRGKNNRFLVCDAVLECNADDGKPSALISMLNFANRQEVLWGDKAEIASYLPELFRMLWEEVTSDDSEYSVDEELYFSDYIPYAKYSTYFNILSSGNNRYAAIFYGIREDDIRNNIESAREKAYDYLYRKCAKRFADIFNQFVDDTTSYHMLDKTLKVKLIDPLFLPLLNELKPTESSLGLRVKNLIYSDLSKCPRLIFDHDVFDKPSLKKLINASSTYIVALEKIQQEMIEEELWNYDT